MFSPPLYDQFLPQPHPRKEPETGGECNMLKPPFTGNSAFAPYEVARVATLVLRMRAESESR
jgi:hypothetical protein